MELLNERRLRELVYGGAVLGAGGGGTIEAGLAAGRQALAEGAPRFVGIEELASNARIVTLSVVGSVSRMTGDRSRPRHGVALRRLASLEKMPVAAIIASEVGPQAVTYGWMESAVTGIPIADAPCNGRAHPLGVMGSLDLHRHPRYRTSTVAIGGSDEDGTRVELALRAPATTASDLVRQAAGRSRLALAVARNPLPASYVREHAAVGGLTYARRVGKLVLDQSGRGLPALLRGLEKLMGGRILSEGRVISAALIEKNGFTIGRILVKEQHRNRNECCVAVCNEYLALQRNGTLLAAFPDLITLFDLDSGIPLSSSAVSVGSRVAAFCVPRQRLKLGSTMKDVRLLRPLERLLNVPLSTSGMVVEDQQQTHSVHISATV
jgi:DUF917 family protein